MSGMALTHELFIIAQCAVAVEKPQRREPSLPDMVWNENLRVRNPNLKFVEKMRWIREFSWSDKKMARHIYVEKGRNACDGFDEDFCAVEQKDGVPVARVVEDGRPHVQCCGKRTLWKSILKSGGGGRKLGKKVLTFPDAHQKRTADAEAVDLLASENAQKFLIVRHFFRSEATPEFAFEFRHKLHPIFIGFEFFTVTEKTVEVAGSGRDTVAAVAGAVVVSKFLYGAEHQEEIGRKI